MDSEEEGRSSTMDRQWLKKHIYQPCMFIIHVEDKYHSLYIICMSYVGYEVEEQVGTYDNKNQVKFTDVDQYKFLAMVCGSSFLLGEVYAHLVFTCR